ncbi:MAG: cell wall hydrolase [Oscillospiraceae bacterium]|nr:cell wall hydrolase [Oscillospiraceae bacterium]
MTLFKKVILTLVAICLFVAATAGFTVMLCGGDVFGFLRQEPQEPDALAYPRSMTEPVWTEATVPPQTEPPQTQPPETEPPTETTLPLETEPEETKAPLTFDTVPVYDMSQYPDIRYLSGSIATSGSNVTALAMVASYMTKHEYTPAMLMDYFGNYIGNSFEWLDYVSDQLQLPWQRALNFHVAKQALQEGKLVIVVMDERKFYTENLHFIVLTGINEEGRITVNDPLGSHYSHWDLSKGLENGFTDGAILSGYRGAWIFDATAMPEEPFIYEPEPNTDEFRYPGIELTEEEIDLMAKVICLEAESEPFEGQQAIAEVILNRLAAGNFQSSVKSIIHAQDQFKGADRLYLAKPTHIQYEAIRRALNGPYVVPKDVVFFATYQVNENVWGTIGEHTFCYQW